MTVTMEKPQHLAALERANEVRLKRAELKRWVYAPASVDESRERAAKVLDAPPWEAETMTAFELLIAVRRTGREAARRLLRLAGNIGEQRKLCDLTGRQRQLLAGIVGAPRARQHWDRRAPAATSAAIVDRLWRAGLREAGLPAWWRTRRDELNGQTPRQALVDHPSRVLALAEADAPQIRRDLRQQALAAS